ncbi:MAG: competence/damage-inducible protein A [Firmicutes bacterium]|nr:competence/damage-inducible protein A [Bacillota bacterium]
MRAEIISVGTELLLGEIVDTNAAFLGRRLAELGVDVYYRQTVGDNQVRLVAAFELALSRADLVLVSGGLGPTMDDITREALAEVLGDRLCLDEGALRQLEAHFTRLGRPMTDNNRRQAYRPSNADFITNRRGTAPGILAHHQGRTIICMPGVPRELETMFEGEVIPRLLRNSNGEKNRVIKSRTLLLTGLGESAAENAIADIIKEQTNPTIAPYAGLGEVRLRLTATAAGAEEALALIHPLEARLRERLGDVIYGVDGDTLEGVVAEKLTNRGLILAVAESCTGGLVSHRLTNIPGSSVFFRQGMIVYSNEAKKELLDVPDEVLEEFGAVSSQVAEAMARGVRLAGDADLGLAITGIAGPGGATPTKPVGLVYLALAYDGDCLVEKHTFSGQREEVKYRASQAALNLLRLHL